MSARPDSTIGNVFAHIGLYNFASCLAGVYLVAFLLHQGVPVPYVFLAMACVHALRFVLRPLVIVACKWVGIRAAMIFGTGLSGVEYLVLAKVSGLDAWLVLFVVVMAVGEGFYWTLFHVLFAHVGDGPRMGHQVGIRQIISAVASVLGPPIGGLLLAWYDPMVAFSLAAVLRVLSAAPLLGVDDPPFERQAPPGAYAAGNFGARAYFNDGVGVIAGYMPWAVICFQGLGERFDELGLALAAAGLVGAVAGFAQGKAIDLGHGRRAAMINFGAGVAVILAQALAGYAPARIIAAMILGSLLGGFATPTLVTAVYAQTKESPCMLRFQFAAEGGWDAGAVAAYVCCAAIASAGAPLQWAMLLAIPAMYAQARLLMGAYDARAGVALQGD